MLKQISLTLSLSVSPSITFCHPSPPADLPNASCVRSELLQVSSCWSDNTGTSMRRGPYVIYYNTTVMTNFNERTNTLLYKKYISHTLFSKGLMLIVCERWVGNGDRLLHIDPIAALLPHLGWGCSTSGY